MKVIGKDHEQNFTINIIEYDTFLKRLKGLMFRLKPIKNEGILLTPCNSIHMFFMFFSIDVVFLNEKFQIVAMKKCVKPWTVIFPVKDAHSTLELPEGTISNYGLKIGQIIRL